MHEKKKGILIISSIILLMIASIILLIPEKQTSLEDGTIVKGSIDEIQIINSTYLSWDYDVNPPMVFLGEGFIHSENATFYEVLVFYKNIANIDLENMEINIKYYDVNDNLLKSPGEEHDKLKIPLLESSQTKSCYFNLQKHRDEDFEKVDHISFHISNSNKIDNNIIVITLLISGILFLILGFYKYRNNN